MSKSKIHPVQLSENFFLLLFFIEDEACVFRVPQISIKMQVPPQCCALCARQNPIDDLKNSQYILSQTLKPQLMVPVQTFGPQESTVILGMFDDII
jgi:hypothetical protein